MVEYLWDGEMDCGWEGLGEKVEATSRKFVKDLLELMPFSYNEEAIKLISEESLSRFQNLAKKLAEELGTNTRYVSAVVNVKFHMNYTSFVNKFRIEEAMSILTDSRYRKLNMEDVSDMVGFSNRQSFYASFYKFNGCTPREYKLRHAMEAPQQAKHRGRKTKSEE